MKLKQLFWTKDRLKVMLVDHFTFTFIVNQKTTSCERVLTELRVYKFRYRYLRNFSAELWAFK